MPEDPQTSAGAPTGAPGQQPSDGNHGVPSPQSSEPEIANPEAKKYADEAARYRREMKAVEKERDELRAFKQQQDDAKLSKEQLYEKEKAEWQTERADLLRQTQERVVRSEIRSLAKEYGLKQELALRLLDYAEIQYDDAGDPTNISALLQQAIETYELAPAAATSNGNGASPSAAANGNGRVPARPQPTSIGSTPANPSRSASNGGPAGGWSWEAISNLTKEQYEGLSPAQRTEMSRFIVSHPNHR